jgi:hypothetical protein
MLQQFMASRGADQGTAGRQASAAMYGMAQQQAAILSYVDTFQLLAVIFLALTPMVLLMKRPKSAKPPVGAH